MPMRSWATTRRASFAERIGSPSSHPSPHLPEPLRPPAVAVGLDDDLLVLLETRPDAVERGPARLVADEADGVGLVEDLGQVRKGLQDVLEGVASMPFLRADRGLAQDLTGLRRRGARGRIPR